MQNSRIRRKSAADGWKIPQEAAKPLVQTRISGYTTLISRRRISIMCTAIRLTTRDHYFGRNLDLEYSYQETVAITPRRYPSISGTRGRTATISP